MSIIVKLKVNRSRTADDWKKDAIGIEDEYGNPFRIIRLRWRNTSLHRMTEYAKTRGFEDAVIGKDDRTNEIAITYRKNGSVMWMRTNGIGSFFGEVAYTPLNMRLLATHWGDKLWDIMDADIKQLAEKMYEEMKKGNTPALNEYNDTRIKKLHSASTDYGENKMPELPLDVETASIREQTRQNNIKRAELDKREAELNQEKQGLVEKKKTLIEDGVQPVMYNREYLEAQKFHALRRICKEYGIPWSMEDKKVDLIEKIVDKQKGQPVEAPEGVIGSLDS